MSNWMSIDFGTCSSAAAIIRNREPELARPLNNDAAGSNIFSTVSFVADDGKIFSCGDAEYMKNSDLSRFKREYKLDIEMGTILPILNVSYIQLVADVLKTLKKAAESFAQNEISNVLVTVPAVYFNDDIKNRKQVMYEAAKSAGFERVEIIKEAEAAAMYYDFISDNNNNSKSLIYDLGGGTFDPSIIEHTSGGYQLLASGNGMEVGGKFFTSKITSKIIQDCHISLSEDNENRYAEINLLLDSAENIKRFLSQNSDCSYPLKKWNTHFQISRAEFENLITPLVDKTIDACTNLLTDCHLTYSDIDRIILIGGSCKVPLVRNKIEKAIIANNASNTHIIWEKTDNGVFFDPQFAVALGGSVYALQRFMVPPHRPSIGFIQYTESGELKNFQLNEGDNTLGRKVFDKEALKQGEYIDVSDVDIPIYCVKQEERKMSRHHLCFKVKFDTDHNTYHYYVEDTSTNGTYVNNTLMARQTKTEIKNNDIIKAGNHLITLITN